MRTFIGLVSILFAASVACGQTSAAPDIQIRKYSWSKERIDWDKNPFGKRTEISYVRSRRGSILEEREARENKAAREKPAPPPRYVFAYKLTVVNAGPKGIREIDWDYVFKDAASGDELGRREFTSVEKIGPGKRHELSVLVSSPPTQRISVYSLGKKERDGVVEQIIISRVLYDDGTIWLAN